MTEQMVQLVLVSTACQLLSMMTIIMRVAACELVCRTDACLLTSVCHTQCVRVCVLQYAFACYASRMELVVV